MNKITETLVVLGVSAGMALSGPLGAQAATVNYDVTGTVTPIASSSCVYGGKVTAYARHDYKITYNPASPGLPLVSQVRFVGIPQALSCYSVTQGFSFEKLSAPKVNNSICQGKEYQGMLLDSVWKKYAGKRLCLRIDSTGTLKEIKRFIIAGGFRYKGFSIQMIPGDLVTIQRYYTLTSYINPYGVANTVSTFGPQ